MKIPHYQSFPTEEFVLLLKPLGKDKSDYHSNKNLITRALTSKGNALRITSIGRVFGGGVKIVTANETDFTAIKVLLESMQDITEAFEITRAQKRKPQVIVYNIDKKIQAEELLEGLLQNNCFLYDANNVPLLKVEFPIQARNKESRHWVVTIDPSIFKELSLKQGLYFNWSRVRFTEFTGIRQCRTCGAFCHTAKYCDDRDKPPICENCSMLKTENHSCRVPKCKNCIFSNEKFKRNWHTTHSVFDKRCESYLRQRDILVKRTNYGN
ncbi:hypothetical protein AVEN_99210-1 [Araneus ventricosus]|uniref:Uncharacterized protein n=1 Tax=Araneus ventricosus TaxID=182803 RepID=A0A4Y2CI47_ARAVE|nr:hypothetical protein AVEN_99210-1 [Araneus ventricosus]